MKKIKFGVLIAMMSFSTVALAQSEFKVEIQQNPNATVTVTPALPADGMVKAGTKLTVSVAPKSGWAFDSSFYSPKMTYGERSGYFQKVEFSVPEFEVVVDKDMAVGGAVVDPKRVEGINVIHDVVYAKPGVKALKYDVYSPKGAKSLPCIIIVHGGGWSSNTEEVMRGLARELVKDGRYVACSIDYRWINNGDGDEKPNQMHHLIEDVYGAILHIQANAAKYGIDPQRLAVTGDSAGGHLSSSVANMVERVGDGGFGVTAGVYEYLPTYLPNGMSAAQAREALKAIKAAAPSYGVFDQATLGNFIRDLDSGAKAAVSPIDNIPAAKERVIPQWLTLGTRDPLIKPEPLLAYIDKGAEQGQHFEMVVIGGASHAFFDWKADERTQATFDKLGVPYAKKMLQFFDTVFYK